MTGDDDPDDRRTYPWADLGGHPDTAMFAHYQMLASLRAATPALTSGDFRMLLADDGALTVAFGRKTTSQAAIVALNGSDQARMVDIPVAGYLPDGVQFASLYGVANPGSVTAAVAAGTLSVQLAPHSAWLLATGNVDLEPPDAPTGLVVTNEASQQLSLAWDAVPGAAGYNLYRSPVSGGGWVKLNQSLLADTTLTDTGLRNGSAYYYVVTALDAAGNESGYSNEANGLPHLTIGWANLQWPPTLTHTISLTNRTDTVYGQVWIDGATSQFGPTPTLRAQAGFGPQGSNPAGNPDWTWVEASFNVDVGNNDEFRASFLPEAVGSFDYVYRYSTTNGETWLYADLNGPVPDGQPPVNPGKMTVLSSGDTTAPAPPTALLVTNTAPSAISLSWTAPQDADLAGFLVLRDGVRIATLIGASNTSYADTDVTENASYSYVVKAVDGSFNVSGPSNEVTATAAPRMVTLVFTVEVPASTDGTGRSVYIAGTLSRLDSSLPDWNPGGVVLTRVDATHWTITLTGSESTQIEYKYALGSWDYVEKDGSCGEIANRQLTLTYGANGTQAVNDTVLNWRNVSPCGN